MMEVREREEAAVAREEEEADFKRFQGACFQLTTYFPNDEPDSTG